MRILFRKSAITKAQRDRVLFAAPIVIALIALFLFNQNKAVFASAWRSPMAMMAARSPGGRMGGALYNIKPGHEMKAAFMRPARPGLPQERVLAASRVREPALAEYMPTAATPMDLAMGPAAFGDSGLPGLGIPGVSRAAPLAGLAPISGPGGGIAFPNAEPSPEPSAAPDPTPTSTPTPIATSTPIAPPTDTIPVPPAPPPPSAVPEPATWAMNLLGLFAIGGVMRGRNRKTRAAKLGSAQSFYG